MLAKIEAYDRSRDPQLSIRGPGLGKIPGGELVKISPTKVPRLIGKKGYMIKMIGNLTHCDIRVGQNGLVVLDGPPEGVAQGGEGGAADRTGGAHGRPDTEGRGFPD